MVKDMIDVPCSSYCYNHKTVDPSRCNNEGQLAVGMVALSDHKQTSQPLLGHVVHVLSALLSLPEVPLLCARGGGFETEIQDLTLTHLLYGRKYYFWMR